MYNHKKAMKKHYSTYHLNKKGASDNFITNIITGDLPFEPTTSKEIFTEAKVVNPNYFQMPLGNELNEPKYIDFRRNKFEGEVINLISDFLPNSEKIVQENQITKFHKEMTKKIDDFDEIINDIVVRINDSPNPTFKEITEKRNVDKGFILHHMNLAFYDEKNRYTKEFKELLRSQNNDVGVREILNYLRRELSLKERNYDEIKEEDREKYYNTFSSRGMFRQGDFTNDDIKNSVKNLVNKPRPRIQRERLRFF